MADRNVQTFYTMHHLAMRNDLTTLVMLIVSFFQCESTAVESAALDTLFYAHQAELLNLATDPFM